MERATVKSSNTGRENRRLREKYDRNSFWIHEDEELPEAGAHVGLCTTVGLLQPRTTPRCSKKVAMDVSHVTGSEVRISAGLGELNSGG